VEEEEEWAEEEGSDAQCTIHVQYPTQARKPFLTASLSRILRARARGERERESESERARERERVCVCVCVLCMEQSPVATEGIGNFETPVPDNGSCHFTSPFRHWYGYTCVNTSLASLPQQQLYVLYINGSGR